MADRRKPQQCIATVYVRDEYRRSGRAKSGFKMHYTKRQCSKRARRDSTFCTIHRTMYDPMRDSRSSRGSEP